MNSDPAIQELEEKLAALDAERAKLVLEIERARRRFLQGTPHASRVEFHVGDAENLPFPDSSFDGAFICWVLEHMSSPLRALSEIRRCLRSGAPLYANEVFWITETACMCCSIY